MRICAFDVEAEFIAQQSPHSLIFGVGEFERAPCDLGAVQPNPVEHSAVNTADRLERLLPVNGVVRVKRGLAGAGQPDLIDAVALFAPRVVNAEPRTV